MADLGDCDCIGWFDILDNRGSEKYLRKIAQIDRSSVDPAWWNIWRMVVVLLVVAVRLLLYRGTGSLVWAELASGGGYDGYCHCVSLPGDRYLAEVNVYNYLYKYLSKTANPECVNWNMITTASVNRQ